MILRILFIIFVIVPLALIMIIVQFALTRLNLPFWNILPKLLFRLGCMVLGIKVKTIGKPILDKPTLMVANHISWVDILALGSIVNVSFVAKSEIKKWPLIGFLTSLQKTIFVERTRKTASKNTANEMAERLANGGAVVLFAEGGSDIGAHILPFRSALVGAVQMAMKEAGAKKIMIQPVTIAYITLQGLQVSRGDRMQLTWNKSNSLIKNIVQILNRPTSEITISFAKPMSLEKGENRKTITKACHAIVRKTHNELTRGANKLSIKQ